MKSLPCLSLFVFIFLFIFSAVSSDPTITGKGLDSPEKNITIGIIPSGSESPFHRELITGVNRNAADFGWNVTIITPDNEKNISAQKMAMTSLIDQRVSMISVNTLDPNAMISEVENATRAGIPVFMHNTLTPVEKLNITSYIGYNQYNGAAEMGYYIARKLAEKHNEIPETVQSKVFILRGLPGFHANQRTTGFINALSQSPGIRIVGEGEAGWDRDTARRIAREAMIKDPGIEVFYGNSDEMAIGAALAVGDLGKEVNKDVYCLGIDGNTPTLEMIKNGTMTATLGVFPDRIGRVIVEQMKKMRDGIPPETYMETPGMVVDEGNVDLYLNGSSWTGAYESVPEFLYIDS